MSDRSTGQRRGRRSLASLVFDASGTTLAMMAMAMIPMSAMAGSAVDMTRLYVVKVRLQQACDAGSLAARKFMTGATLASAAEQQAQQFFKSNFPEGWFSTTDVSFTPTATADNQVTATATATVPMAVMQMVGVDPITLEVSCDAKLEISNADIMFVLDVTGSMNCAASDSTGCSNGGVEKSNSKIGALRTAVVDFYDTIDAAIDSDARLRFGFVPYSNNVNVGGLLPANYFSDSWNYQSRVSNYQTADHVAEPGTPTEHVVEIYMNNGNIASISQTNCARFGRREAVGNYGSGPWNVTLSGGPPPAATINKTWSNNPGSGADWGYPGAPDTSGDNRSCRRNIKTHPTTYVERYRFTNWTYRQESYDTSDYKSGSAVSLAVGGPGTYVPTAGSYDLLELAALAGTTGVAVQSSSWNGCIEERETVSESDFSPIPPGATDLDIDTIPSSEASRWKPAWPDVIYGRKDSFNPITDDGDVESDILGDGYDFSHATTSNFSSRSYIGCPKTALNLEEMTRGEVESYLRASNGFLAVGGTYHDVGMIWGARLLSPTGIFASDNESAPNGKPISRHIIFMTDGFMSPHRELYGLYGIEQYDRRITDDGSSNHTDRHNARFAALCDAVRNKNITIWVVAYAQTMTNELRDCATPGKAYYAANDDQLKEAFKNIAQQIADLRLSR